MSIASVSPLLFPSVIESPIGKLTYHEESGMYVTKPFQSLAGNVYFEGFRFSEHIIVRTSIGIGFKYDFINSIQIYRADGSCDLLIGKDFHCYFYSEEAVQQEIITLLHTLLHRGVIPHAIHQRSQLLTTAEDIVCSIYGYDRPSLLVERSLSLIMQDSLAQTGR